MSNQLLLYVTVIFSIIIYVIPYPYKHQIRGLTQKQTQEVLEYHNRRRSVLAAGRFGAKPPAANMLMMHYDERVAEWALKQADMCQGPMYGNNPGMGQNIYEH